MTKALVTTQDQSEQHNYTQQVAESPIPQSV